MPEAKRCFVAANLKFSVSKTVSRLEVPERFVQSADRTIAALWSSGPLWNVYIPDISMSTKHLVKAPNKSWKHRIQKDETQVGLFIKWTLKPGISLQSQQHNYRYLWSKYNITDIFQFKIRCCGQSSLKWSHVIVLSSSSRVTKITQTCTSPLY
jgi:hypothetical protein